MNEKRIPLEFTNPNRGWVVGELDKLWAEWLTWEKTVATIVDQPYDRNTHSSVFADGEENIETHAILQNKTLTFLENNLAGHGLILEKGSDSAVDIAESYLKNPLAIDKK